jgi:AcrR family transcriptional regulator
VSEQSTERRARILDAALSEFVEHGYAGASTAGIAERAGVAKALVFHYFSSKDELFVAVAESVTTRAHDEFNRVLSDAPADLAARVLAWTERKLALFREDPRMMRFFLFVLPAAPPAVRDAVRARHKALALDQSPRLLEGIDPSRLAVSPKEALDALETLALGFEQRLYALPAKLRAGPHVERLTNEARKVFSLLARSLYRAPASSEPPER